MDGDKKQFSVYESDAERYLSELIWSFKYNMLKKTLEEYFDSNIRLTVQMLGKVENDKEFNDFISEFLFAAYRIEPSQVSQEIKKARSSYNFRMKNQFEKIVPMQKEKNKIFKPFTSKFKMNKEISSITSECDFLKRKILLLNKFEAALKNKTAPIK